jgi:hypothetical protein
LVQGREAAAGVIAVIGGPEVGRLVEKRVGIETLRGGDKGQGEEEERAQWE